MDDDPWTPTAEQGNALSMGDLVIAGVLGGMAPLILGCSGACLGSGAKTLEFVLVGVAGSAVGARVASRSSVSPAKPAMTIGAFAAVLHTAPMIVFWAVMAGLARSPAVLGTSPERMEMLVALQAVSDTMLLAGLFSWGLAFVLGTLAMYGGMMGVRAGAMGAKWQGPNVGSVSRRQRLLHGFTVFVAFVGVLVSGVWTLENTLSRSLDSYTRAMEMDPQRGNTP